ncbi:MAG: hypothetical protein RMN25_00810 [Anaerolineae bacterium]|nr:hypothetical protein [Thermoflexales bacterium]MDW8406296.1 hypothetical protein [Anaerolineae bacterium]
MVGRPAPQPSPVLSALKSIADVLREVDVRPIRAAAETPFLICFVSRDIALAQHVTSLLYRGPRSNDRPSQRVIDIVTPEEASNRWTSDASVPRIAVILTREGRDNTTELKLTQQLARLKTPTVVCLIEPPNSPPLLRQHWLPASAVSLSTLGDPADTLDDKRVVEQLSAALRATKAVDDLALARHLPAFREQVAHGLIEETAIANAIYSAGAGVAEIIPLVTVPLNAADLAVLTKNQAILAYKIALAMGMTADFKQILPQIAAVVGGGFIFRQAARTLVGLVPGWGILPKTAIAFAGTFAIGEAIYRWCATGERLTDDALSRAYQSALARGRKLAQALLSFRSGRKAVQRRRRADDRSVR